MIDERWRRPLAFAVVGDLFILPALLAAGGKFFEPLGNIKVRMADHDSTPDDPAGSTLTGDGGHAVTGKA